MPPPTSRVKIRLQPIFISGCFLSILSTFVEDTFSIMNDLEEYKYTPLIQPADMHCNFNSLQFRLLTIHPAEDLSATIRCSMTTCYMYRAMYYHALSYTWGDELPTCPIIVDEHIIKVTPKLNEALLYLRSPSKLRTFWIDAICINQSDLEEKSYQVPIMHIIYSWALTVLIWLDKADIEVESAFAYIKTLSKLRTNEARKAFDLEGGRARFEAVAPGIRKIFSNPWWSRAWTAQECAVARKDPRVYCGHSNITYQCLVQLLEMVIDKVDLAEFVEERVAAAVFEMQMNRMAYLSAYMEPAQDHPMRRFRTMHWLLTTTSYRLSKEPRDKIFAIIGMMPLDDLAVLKKRGFVVDYKMSVSSIYQWGMVEAIRSSGGLDFLFDATSPIKDEQHNLPSWCIDFSIPSWFGSSSRGGSSEKRPLSQIHTRKSPHHCNGIDLSRGFEVEHNSLRDSLKVIGTRIGSVTYVHTASLERSTGASLASIARVQDHSTAVYQEMAIVDSELLERCMQKSLELRVGAETTAALLKAGVIWKVISGGPDRKLQEKWLASIERMLYGAFCGLKHLELLRLFSMAYVALSRKTTRSHHGISTSEAELTGWVSPETSTAFSRLFEALSAHVALIGFNAAGCSFFCTDTNFIGRADHHVRNGDLICVLQKCCRPAVLRPCGCGQFQLVSFAYTHDVFEEDSETQMDFTGCKVETFELV